MSRTEGFHSCGHTALDESEVRRHQVTGDEFDGYAQKGQPPVLLLALVRILATWTCAVPELRYRVRAYNRDGNADCSRGPVYRAGRGAGRCSTFISRAALPCTFTTAALNLSVGDSDGPCRLHRS
jgi:hypothetical protein